MTRIPATLIVDGGPTVLEPLAPPVDKIREMQPVAFQDPRQARSAFADPPS